jgi:hypothetical protein
VVSVLRVQARRWIFMGDKFPDLFLTRDILLLRYQMALVVESG